MSLSRYKYSDLHPNHKVWGMARYWAEDGTELVSDECINDAVEYILDDNDMLDGTLEIYGLADYPDCPDNELPEEGFPIKQTCIVEVNVNEWIKENNPEWLTPTDKETK